MRVCRKNKTFLLLGLAVILCCGPVSYAGDQFVKIKQAKLILTQNKAKLQADLDFQLSYSAQEALHSGISLFWDVSITLKQERWEGLWYKTLFAQSYRYSLNYYTLLNNYRVKDEKKNTFRRFSTLKEALVYMQHIESKDMPLEGYVPDQCVVVVLNVFFDKEMLPAPLRPVAYFSKEWDLSANEKQWCE